jgi:anti-sigma B factor antagonist
VTGRAGRTLRPTGELTVQTAAARAAVLTSAVTAGETLTLDLSRVTEMDTAGLQVVLVALAEARAAGGAARIVSPSPTAREVLTLAGLSHLVTEVAS